MDRIDHNAEHRDCDIEDDADPYVIKAPVFSNRGSGEHFQSERCYPGIPVLQFDQSTLECTKHPAFLGLDAYQYANPTTHPSS